MLSQSASGAVDDSIDYRRYTASSPWGASVINILELTRRRTHRFPEQLWKKIETIEKELLFAYTRRSR